jgi:hypothetical protein
MKPEIREIVDLIISGARYAGEFRHFENEHFMYWVFNDRYYYDGNRVSRDEFKCVNDYAIHLGTLPNVERKKRNAEKPVDDATENKIKSATNISTGTSSGESIIRYSKTYDTLEYYKYSTEIRTPHNKKIDRIIAMRKKYKVFSIRNNGYVIFGKKWLSLKNWAALKYQNGLSEELMTNLIHLMIGKDWVRDLDTDNTYMITNKNARKANSLEEAVELECGCKPAKNIERILGGDINEIINLYNLIEPNKINYITSFILKNKKAIELMGKKSYSGCSYLIFLYFLCRDNRCEFHIINDYVKMLLKLGQKLNLKISSYSTIKANHDKASKEILIREAGKGRLRIKSVYPNIKSIEGLEVEKIRTILRLKEESSKLHHCVITYKDRINRGECAIYSLKFNDNSYTMELQAKSTFDGEKEEKYLHVNQLRGLFNCDPPIQMKELFIKMCENAGIISANINFSLTDKREKKSERKVINIGEKILDRIDNYGNIERVYDEPKEEQTPSTNFPQYENLRLGTYENTDLPW